MPCKRLLSLLRTIVSKNESHCRQEMLINGCLATGWKANHSLRCCKSDQLFLCRMSKLGVSELRNPWTNYHSICHGWLRRQYDPACQNFKRFLQLGRAEK